MDAGFAVAAALSKVSRQVCGLVIMRNYLNYKLYCLHY